MPAVSEKQRKFMGADLSRLRSGKKTKTGMNEKQLEDFASKSGGPMTLNDITKSLQELAKARTYIKPGEQPPKGVNVQHGKKGGAFYESTNDNASKKPATTFRPWNQAEYEADEDQRVKEWMKFRPNGDEATAYEHGRSGKTPSYHLSDRIDRKRDVKRAYEIGLKEHEAKTNIEKSTRHAPIHRLYKASGGSKSFGEAANRTRPPRQSKGSGSFGAAASKNKPYTTEYKSMDEVVKSLQEITKGGMGSGRKAGAVHNVSPKSPRGTIAARKNPGQAGII